MASIEYQGITFESIEVVETSSVLNDEQLTQLRTKVEIASCHRNAYHAAKASAPLGAVCVEGFIKYVSHHSEESYTEIVGHCWTKLNGVHFDITVDLVWSATLGQFSDIVYYPLSEHTCTEYENNLDDEKNMIFQSKAHELAKAIIDKMRVQYEERERKTTTGTDAVGDGEATNGQ